MASAVSILNLGSQVFRRSCSRARHAVLHSWDQWRLRPAHGGIGKLGNGGTEILSGGRITLSLELIHHDGMVFLPHVFPNFHLFLV